MPQGRRSVGLVGSEPPSIALGCTDLSDIPGQKEENKKDQSSVSG